MNKIDLIAVIIAITIISTAIIISPDNPKPIKAELKAELLCKRVHNIESKANIVLECWRQNK
jgi:hypothetical protein